MPRLHWSVYIIIGLFVSVVSKLIDYQKLIFFFYIGIIFIFVGIVKLVFGSKKKYENKFKIQKNIPQARHNLQRFKRCMKCGNVIRMHDRFCPRCGARVIGQADLGIMVCPNHRCGWTNEAAVRARGEFNRDHTAMPTVICSRKSTGTKGPAGK